MKFERFEKVIIALQSSHSNQPIGFKLAQFKTIVMQLICAQLLTIFLS